MVLDHVVKEFPIRARDSAAPRWSGSRGFRCLAGDRSRRDVRPGGESGCGKTTLGRLIVGLERLDTRAGLRRPRQRLAILGTARRRRRVRRAGTQLAVFQDPTAHSHPHRASATSASHSPDIDIGAFSRSPSFASSWAERGCQELRAVEVETPHRVLHECSASACAGAALAEAGVVQEHGSSALHLEEVADPESDEALAGRAMNLTYVVISHDLSVLRYLTDRIGIMYLGKLVELGPSHEATNGPPTHIRPRCLTRSRSLTRPIPVTRARRDSKANCHQPPIRRRAAGFEPGVRAPNQSAPRLLPRCDGSTLTRIAPRAIFRSGPRSTTPDLASAAARIAGQCQCACRKRSPLGLSVCE